MWSVELHALAENWSSNSNERGDKGTKRPKLNALTLWLDLDNNVMCQVKKETDMAIMTKKKERFFLQTRPTWPS